MILQGFLNKVKICFLAGALLGVQACKKDKGPTYTNINVSISLLEYTFVPYASGTWSTAVKARVRSNGALTDSLTYLLPAFNAPQGTPQSNACGSHLNTITHAFKTQDDAVNVLEFYDATGVRITFDLTPAAVYFSTASDSTTSYLPNGGCSHSVFLIR